MRLSGSGRSALWIVNQQARRAGVRNRSMAIVREARPGDASEVDGDLTLRTGNSADTSGITDSGTVTVGGNLSVTNDVDNGDIDMGTLAVTGTIALTTQGGSGNATVVNASAIDFATSTSGGRITATARGPITQSGVITPAYSMVLMVSVSPHIGKSISLMSMFQVA